MGSENLPSPPPTSSCNERGVSEVVGILGFRYWSLADFRNHRSEISLSPNFATKDVFPGGYYASPWDVLEPVWGAIRSSRKLRHEVMAYFWIRYHFKITLSTFSGPIYSPLSHVWLLEYLPIIQRLTIEVDLTRLGGSSIKGAPRLNYDNDKINMFVATIVKGLLKRRGGVIEELNLMCRRYDGSRLNHSKGLEIQGSLPYYIHWYTY